MNEMFNIEIKDDILSFYYIPEGKGEKGYVEYDIKNKKYIKLILSEYDKELNLYNTYAKRAVSYILYKLRKNEEIKSKHVEVWY